ncbi:hypothetical protein ABZ770_26855 [Streptomyces sp. NPDC006654]|uniref:hypothetical protein n=1 Tax=unclassified Streptomyces TaxID=2593676 RepID=UPI0034076D1C
MLEFVGYQVLDPVVAYGPARMSGQEGAAALEAVSRELGHATSPCGALVTRGGAGEIPESRWMPREYWPKSPRVFGDSSPPKTSWQNSSTP